MMVGDGNKLGVDTAAAGLFSSVGHDVFRYEAGQSVWQATLQDGFSVFDLDPLARPQSSPDGQHGAFITGSGAERYVCVFGLPSRVIRILPTVLSRVVGMSWSSAGKRLCVVAGDPSVGVLSMDRSRSSSALPAFSLFLAEKDDPDLTRVTGPMALPGIPRWSPAGDALAVVGLERGCAQVALIVTTDGREGPLVSGERVILGAVAWTASGSLLCSVSERGGGVHIQLVDTATGESAEQGEPWEDVCWLSLVGKRVLVAGQSGGAWVVADVTGGVRTVLTPSFARIIDVGATPGCLWVVAPVENGDLGLWSTGLQGEALRLRFVAPSISGMHARVDGRTVAFMAGPSGAETVHIATLDDETVLDIGRRDMIMGWIEELLPPTRQPRLHYLLTPAFEAVHVRTGPFSLNDAETGTLEIPDAPEPLAPFAPLVPAEEADGRLVSDAAAAQTVPVDGQVAATAPRRAGRRPPDRPPWPFLVAALTVVVLAVAVLAVSMAGREYGRQEVPKDGTSRVDTPSTPAVVTPATPSVSTPNETVPVTLPAVAAPPKVSPVASPSVPNTASTTPPAIVTYGVRTGLWVAPTEQVRVRSAAGTGNTILGYLLVDQRARVLSGPTVVSATPWWHVRCYDTDGTAGMVGWISGEYLRPSSAPVESPAVEPAVPAAQVPVLKSTKGTIVLTSVPSGARVFVNGKEGGVTPLTLTWPAGEVHIAINLPGYLYYAVTVIVKAGATTRLVCPLLLLESVGH